MGAAAGAPGIRNENTASAHVVVQIGSHAGDLVFQGLPAVPTPASAAPFQVPAEARGFVNRVEEMKVLHEAVADPHAGPRIIVCRGLRGIGTSETTRRFAHQARDRFPGGQLYVDYEGLQHRGGAAVGDVVASCLRDLGVGEDFLPASLPARLSQFRSRTAAAAFLVVLDGAREPQQVRSLLPNSPGSVVLVASDEPLTELLLDGADLVEIGRLSSQDGVALLGQSRPDALAGDRAVAAEVVELCEGLPVALRVVAARLRADPYLDLSAVLGELRDESSRLPSLSLGSRPVVSAVFSASARDLPQDAARLYRLLGWCPGPDVTVRTAAVLTGLDDAAAVAALWRLVELGLAQRTGPDRARLHPLVRLHAREVLHEQRGADLDGDRRREVDEAVRRVVLDHLARAVAADHAVMGRRTRLTPDGAGEPERAFAPFEDAAAGLAWLGQEVSVLMGCLRAAHEHGWHDLTWQYAETLTALFFNRRDFANWCESGLTGATAAQQDGRPDVQARLLLTTSRALIGAGQGARAAQAVLDALAIAERLEEPVLLASAWEFHGRLLGDGPDAERAFEHSIEFNRQAGETRGQGLAEYFLAGILSRTGRHGAAVALFDSSMQAMLAVGDARMAPRVQAAKAVALAAGGDPAAAIELLRDAVTQLDRRGLFHYEADVLEQLAAVHASQGDDEARRECLRRAAEIHERFGSLRAETLRTAAQSAPDPHDQSGPDRG